MGGRGLGGADPGFRVASGVGSAETPAIRSRRWGAMRRLDEINDYADIYQPVPEVDILSVESRLGFTFPEGYRRFVKNPDMDVIKGLPSLLWFDSYDFYGILEKNSWLRERDFRPYPEHLI